MPFTALGFFIPAAIGGHGGRKLLLALNFNLGFTLGAEKLFLIIIKNENWTVI
jgi:hypothetical protein